jgi:hypothetical protein
MDKKELQNKLDFLGVDSNQYSLEGELNPYSIILYHSYNNWNVFYLDERGGRDNENIFHSESEACKYIYKLFKEYKEIEEKYLKPK